MVTFSDKKIWLLSITKEVTRGYLYDLMTKIVTTLLVKKLVTEKRSQKTDHRKSVTKLITKN